MQQAQALLFALLLAFAASPVAQGQAARSGIVIGAGVAGLKAAADLVAKGYTVTVLEARPRIGGRVWTQNTAQFGPLELGAQWIHGTNNPVYQLAQSQGWQVTATDLEDGAEFEALPGGKAKEISDPEETEWDNLLDQLTDRVTAAQRRASDSASLQSVIDEFKTSLSARQKMGVDARVDQEWTQEYGADPKDLSLNWFDSGADLTGGDSVLRLGFSATLINHLQTQAAKATIVTGDPVTAVSYSPSARVTVTTASGKSYKARFAIITVPLGVLQRKPIAFSPALPASKLNAISRLGMGVLNKVIIAFPETADWDNVNWIDRIPLASDTTGRFKEFFSLRKATGKPVIVGFNAGDAGQYPSALSNATLVSEAVAALRSMFPDIPATASASWITRWDTDPYAFGSYSISKPGTKSADRKNLAASVRKLLYFAGEAASVKYPATVQGAYETGAAAAAQAAKENP